MVMVIAMATEKRVALRMGCGGRDAVLLMVQGCNGKKRKNYLSPINSYKNEKYFLLKNYFRLLKFIVSDKILNLMFAE